MLADVLEQSRVGDEAPLPLTKIRSLVTDAVEDGVHSALRAIKHGRYAAQDAIQSIKHGRHVAQDAIEEAQHKVKQKPLQAMGIALAAGTLLGGFLSWIEFRRR